MGCLSRYEHRAYPPTIGGCGGRLVWSSFDGVVELEDFLLCALFFPFVQKRTSKATNSIKTAKPTNTATVIPVFTSELLELELLELVVSHTP